ncbi:hypothetical protein [Sphingopyxis sp. GC21]|uniref:hypothetical protein n=1 Tax=Sphingopyxis sp. GC21 TaxID=2933562 RepID=UPI0021E4FDE6|nr:hypothetical protein [Sphingopyxis sp. GC21]
MRRQALDRQMGFAGVGGAKDSLDRVGGVGRHFLGCNAGTGGAAAQQRIDEGGSIRSISRLRHIITRTRHDWPQARAFAWPLN